MKIRTKFGAFTGMAVLVTAVPIAVVAFMLQKRLIERNMQEVRLTQSEGFAAVCRQAITVDNELFMVNYARLFQESPAFAYAYFVDGDGRIRVHTDKKFFYKTLDDWLPAKPGGVIEAARPVVVGGSRRGTAVIGFSEAYARPILEQALKRTLASVSVAAGGVALCVSAGALVFALVLTRPIKALSDGSEKVATGDFTVQVEVRSDDEVGSLARQFNEMTKQLAILDELKDEFISSVSHDLRSPMSAIKMYTQYMLFEDPDKDKILPSHRTFLLTIMESATRLGVFVTNILDAAKIKAGRAEYHVQPMEASASAKNVQGIFGILAEKKGVQLSVDFPMEAPRILADPERFDHVIANLVSNSLKFTPPGGKIVIGGRQAGDKFQVFVQDTGKGISPENLGKLFRRFGQVDVADQRSKRVTGTGLGLFIVKQAVEGMNGAIDVSSEPGKGTRFTVTMPSALGALPPHG